MSQATADSIRLSIIKKRKLEISILEKKRDDIISEINTQKEYLKAYQKTVPISEALQ